MTASCSSSFRRTRPSGISHTACCIIFLFPFFCVFRLRPILLRPTLLRPTYPPSRRPPIRCSPTERTRPWCLSCRFDCLHCFSSLHHTSSHVTGALLVVASSTLHPHVTHITPSHHHSLASFPVARLHPILPHPSLVHENNFRSRY